MQINTSISAYQTYKPQATSNASGNNSASTSVNSALNPVDSVEISTASLRTSPFGPGEVQQPGDDGSGEGNGDGG